MQAKKRSIEIQLDHKRYLYVLEDESPPLKKHQNLIYYTKSIFSSVLVHINSLHQQFFFTDIIKSVFMSNSDQLHNQSISPTIAHHDDLPLQ